MPNDQEWWKESETDAANIFGDCVPSSLIPWLIAEAQRRTKEALLPGECPHCGVSRLTCWSCCKDFDDTKEDVK
jgi:hypothetical protein